VVVLSRVGLCSIDGFVESFSGDGPFQGLDNPGWLVGSENGEFRPGGFYFEGGGFEREVFGFGSFATTLRLNDVDLDSIDDDFPPGAEARIELNHHFQLEGGANREISLHLSEVASTPADSWTLRLYGQTDGVFRVSVPQSTASSIELGVNYLSELGTFSVFYDNDVSDAVAALQFGPFLLGDSGPVVFDGLIVNAVLFKWSDPLVVNANVTFNRFSLTGVSDLRGDFDQNGELNIADLDLLASAVRDNDVSFDLNGDGLTSVKDIAYWVHDLRGTYFGDSNLDGSFDSVDLVTVFQIGEFEDGTVGNSTWSEGDWNGDADFTTSDLVLAFQDGGYGQASRMFTRPVPEPAGLIPHQALILMCFIAFRQCRSRDQRQRGSARSCHCLQARNKSSYSPKEDACKQCGFRVGCCLTWGAAWRFRTACKLFAL
jgi:hypothetical protein